MKEDKNVRHCYAMTCKRRIVVERLGSRSCAPHLAVVVFAKIVRRLSFGAWPYDWTYALMGLMYRKEDRVRRNAGI